MNRYNATFGYPMLLVMMMAGGAIAQAPGDHHPAGYYLVFADEFDGRELNRHVWCTRYIYAGGSMPQIPDAVCQADKRGTLDRLNDEQQRYVDMSRDGRKCMRSPMAGCRWWPPRRAARLKLRTNRR